MRTPADSPTKTCTQPGCARPLRARGLCPTHYNREYHPTRHKPKQVSCAWCGTIVTRAGGGGRKYGFACSTSCRRALAYGVTPSTSRELVPIKRAPRTDQRPRPARRPRWHVAGVCRVCATPFLSPHLDVTCSAACQAIRDADSRRDHKHRYRARRRGALITPVSPRTIYERDGWTCRLCGRPIDRDADPQSPLAPSLDHIIPLANGGTHEPSNVWTAHRQCNSERANRPFVIVGRAKQRIATLF
ncbi:HNH endonuclease [Brachybacterium muris]|uniref:HNH endonuclease n=1 Tax=Brachybacterium muris TaxID=219301 RepID=UPI003B968DAB